MEVQGSPVETTASAEPQLELNARDSPLEIRETDHSFVSKRVGAPSLILIVAGFVLLLAIGRKLATLVSRVEPSSSSSALPRVEHPVDTPAEAPVKTPVEQLPKRDDWGLPSLEHFEETLPPKLKEGKELLAAWASQYVSEPTVSEYAKTYQRAVALALSNGSNDSLVGMTIVLENVKPFNWSIEDKPLPQALRITGVVEYYRWNLVLTAEDIATKKEYLVNIPGADISKRSNFSEDAFREEMRRTAEHEKNAALQACGCMPAGLAASQKGISIPVYTGEISGLDQIHSVGNIRIYGTVGLMEGAVRNFGHLSHRIGTLDEKARDYMAYRLLMVALKLEQAGVAHLELDWSGLFLREDGSFLLGNFGSAAPFGHERPFLTGVLPRYPEPNVIVQLSESGLTMPEAKTNMWHLGILLFHLYTGNQDPYGGHMGRDAMQEIMILSKLLLEKGLRSNVLIPELEASNVPRRWVELIVRLLEPTRAHRINGFQIVREFPDLINQQAE